MKKALLIVSVLILTRFTFAQKGEIIYTDFEPNLCVHYSSGYTNPSILVDLDHNDTTDFRFYCESDYGQWVSAVLRNTNATWQFRIPYQIYDVDPGVPHLEDTVYFGDNIAEIEDSWAGAYRFFIIH